MGLSLPSWRSQPKAEPVPVDHDRNYTSDSSDPALPRDGNLAFTRAQGGNGAKAMYQEAIGAPVESNSPLGYHVGWLTIIFLNVNQMIGTAGSILNSTGSIGLALIYWFIGFIMAIAGFCVYLEFASYFPSRSGAEVVYLEQAYPRPKHFFPIAFAVQSVVLSFSSSNAIVLSRYLWRIAGKVPSDWEMKGVAIAAYTLAVICVIAHNKYSFWAVNVLGFIKIVTLIFISITGFVVLGGNVSSVPDPNANFRNAFEGTTDNGNDLSTALVNIVFSYTGYANAFSVVNEVKRPIPTIKKHGFISIVLVAVLYMLCNIAYFATVPKKEFAESDEIAAAVFFTGVFGDGGAVTALNPFGTPIGPYLLKWAMTFIMIVAPPAGDAFQFVVSLKTYPEGLFFLAMSIGLYIVRRHNKRMGRGRPEFKAWDVFAIFFILIQIFIIVMPWYPPKGGPYAGDVSFWYATYCVVGIAIMVLCGVYYVLWIYVIPKWRGYAIRPEVVEVDDNGANSHRLVRVPLVEVEKWDSEHDEAGAEQRPRRTAPPRQSQKRPSSKIDSSAPEPKAKQPKKNQQSNTEAAPSSPKERPYESKPRLKLSDLEFEYDRSQLRDPRPTPGRERKPHYTEFNLSEEFKSKFYIPENGKPENNPLDSFYDLHECHKKGPDAYNKKSIVNGMEKRLAKGEQEEKDLYGIFFVDGKGPEGVYGMTVKDYIKDHISKDLGIPWHQIDAKKAKKWEEGGFEKIKASDWWCEPNKEEKKRMDKMHEGCDLRKVL
ncbi:high affinity methionine permease [Fusarium heterosporum]|uniref:High affinity methionine permease n=1 Tax=Fusarium heterosporum TaxID=42747 RepID=A0A8H5X3F2_FUSHE|nr:high affinity methionine permease [Fusarium heterosporum]